ncbi:hypothetical protein SP28804_2046 [Streptococcus pneumoniae CDC0288-04]|nr:hypothetical protein SP28804_2046 [Streptococcus pneumoniae CDC0288-04]EHD55775.1 hypothetical protein SPAR70_2435 [Streptococcus pneumoniae GA41410]EHD62163.1 hypothetical protein SPAR72_2255 [Streptococcus pneumoniae GA41538]EHE19029.1 hypothetical protein SPAR71_2293 [Streptococcus pneumoniae GA41437]EJG42029.1 hypothetical protein AMCSP13_002643 [Streptococcus pneumoniae 2070335]QJS37924.1 hypothetical protein HKM25_2276 [Streptococcus pneumoniae]
MQISRIFDAETTILGTFQIFFDYLNLSLEKLRAPKDLSVFLIFKTFSSLFFD